MWHFRIVAQVTCSQSYSWQCSQRRLTLNEDFFFDGMPTQSVIAVEFCMALESLTHPSKHLFNMHRLLKGRVKSKSTHQPQKSGELISGKFCGIYRGPIWIILIIILITPFLILLLLLSLQISKNTGRPCRGFGMVSPLNLTLGFRFRFAFVLIGLFLRSNTWCRVEKNETFLEGF